jgi:hypothetical protein
MTVKYLTPDEGIGDALAAMGFSGWCINCATGEIEQPELTEEQLAEVEAHRQANVLWARVRARRDSRLAATDRWALSDRTMPESMRAYRQALRDVTNQPDPENITWPVRPDV